MTSTNDILASATHSHDSGCWWNHDTAGWVCAAGGNVPAAEPALVDTRDMLVVHTALLREIRLAPAAVRRVPVGRIRAAKRVDRHLGFLCDLLHHHHSGEDELLWPKLRERVPTSALADLDTAEGQHAAIDSCLARVVELRAVWTASTDEESRDALAAAFGELHRLLAEHLDLEERALLPRAACLLTEAEWHAVGEAAVTAMPKPDLALAFGMFAYEGDPEVLRAMLQSAPAVPRYLLPKIAPRLYARRARRIYGLATP